MEYKKLEIIQDWKKLTDQEMGDIVGISNSGYRKMINKKSCRVDYLEKIARYFEIPLMWFWEPLRSEKEDPSKISWKECRNADCILEKEKLKIENEDLRAENKKLLDTLYNLSKKND